MVKCDKCNGNFASGEVSATCTVGKKSFHPACTRIGSAQNITKAKLKSWNCDSCKGESISVTSEEGEDKKSILEAMQLMNSNLDSKLSAVQSSLVDLTTEMRQINTKLQKVEEEQSALRQDHTKLEHEQRELCNEMQLMQERLLDMEQHSRCANIEVQGVPQTHGEDIYSILEKIARAISVEYHRGDVSIAHRLRKFSKKHVHPPIIAQFVSRTVKEEWMTASKKKKGLKSTELAPSLPPSNIYLNHHLSPSNKELLGRARRLFKEGKLYFAGYTNGKVIIKPREGDQTVRVSHLVDLNRYDKN